MTTFPDTTTEQITSYDKDSNILKRLTRAGQELDFAYDALDRMTDKTQVTTGLTTTWQHYLNGTISVLTDSNGNDIYTLNSGSGVYYDTAGRLVRVDTPGMTAPLSVNYTLDPSGNRTLLVWPDNYCAAYSFDSLSRMTTVKDGTMSSGACNLNTGAALASYTYSAMSRRLNLAYPNASMAYGYSDAGDLKTLNHSHTGTTGTVPAYTMAFTAAHQLASEASSDLTYTLQLATTGTDSYTAANSLNQYPSWSPNGGASQAFTYDLNGNMTGGTIAGAAWTFGYDPENRLITANKSGGSVTATYAYDPLGRRNHKSGTGVSETYFLSDGADEIAEYSSPTTEIVRYVPGPAINEPVASVTVSTSSHRYFQTDHHGSVIAMVSQGGNELEGPYTYDAYGNCFTGSTACGSSGTPYRFVGMRLDTETGLYYDRARYYSSALGRFPQTDPVGYEADLNLYIYSANDPENLFDPSGDQVAVAPCPPPMFECPIILPLPTSSAGGQAGRPVNPGGIDDAELKNIPVIGAFFNPTAYENMGSALHCLSIVFCSAQDIKNLKSTRAASFLPTAGASSPDPDDNQNKRTHIFNKPGHGLDKVVQEQGGERQAYQAIREAIEEPARKAAGPTGKYEVTVRVGSQNVTVRGVVQGGTIRMGTAFVKP